MPIKPLVFAGSDFEVGFQQGRSCSENINRAIKKVFALEQIMQKKPRLLPTPVFVMLAKRRADKLLRKDLLGLYPKQAERIRGIADGAEVDFSSLLFIQMLELLFAGCTSLGFFSRVTSPSETILAKNFDYASFAEPYAIVCETQPDKGYKSLCCRLTPLTGTLDGMNEYGLSVTYNLARSVDERQCYVPTSMILQEMLETCKNTQEGVNFLTKAKTGGHDGIITLADAEDNIKTVELSCQHVKIQEPESDIMINTNHFQTPEMKSIEKVPVYPNSIRRFERAKCLLENKKNINENFIKAVLRDHGIQNSPCDATICMHGKQFGTCRSMIMYPRKRLITLLFGHPCEREYNKIKFS
jgi:predicted choloylglycine hydrolase